MFLSTVHPLAFLAASFAAQTRARAHAPRLPSREQPAPAAPEDGKDAAAGQR